ncbi:MAG: hypothetical protein G8D81_20605 [gamma proteobacterium symbiont of Clathrolucina costata]|nr:hypothetical protein [Candidatus Thiodiazotropha taylori]MCW4262735.1 hypothetical protein [Candidatus Thiodiazotropha endolucinida]MCG8031538.1 hypothetical protein [Candidatus Thiodiazotropha taylori]MCG8044355.1 hypothetical protein [Candidatus Thiodiazotropha taylori]MCW4333298.1 hypothetical protein [Candidatus Thiodiazotropha endolucinida]
MSHCCSEPGHDINRPSKHRCPANGIEYSEVSAKTVTHHVYRPWLLDGHTKRYYFCDDPTCDVIYFGDDDSVISQAQVRTRVGVKEQSDDAMLCYCFGVTKSDAASEPGIRAYIVRQTKLGVCSCETSNPAGVCCLKTFP